MMPPPQLNVPVQLIRCSNSSLQDFVLEQALALVPAQVLGQDLGILVGPLAYLPVQA
jgi:hypothetical protein